MDFLLLAPLRYGNIASSTKSIAYLKLAFSSRGIGALGQWGIGLFLLNGSADFHVLNRWTASINLDTTDALLGNAYNQVPIFHEHEIYVIDLFIISITQLVD